ncbi:MAG: hypothetical protein ACRDI2_26865, partial [Chloroflexota bacterium]
RFFLWSNALIQRFFFSPDEPGQVWVEPGQPEDHADLRRLYAAYGAPDAPSDEDQAAFEALLGYPDVRLRVAHDRDGQAVGFSAVLPVCQESISLLQRRPAYAQLVEAYWNPSELAALPATAQDTTIFCFLHLVQPEALSGAVRSALLRELLGVFAYGGTYLCSTPRTRYKRLLEECGFERIPGARYWPCGARRPSDGYALDLSRIGLETWLEALLSGRRPPRPPDQSELERALQETFLHWQDDTWLASSPLAGLLMIPAPDCEAQRPAAVRRVIQDALEEARAQATPELELAYRAVELAYIQKATSHERAAERLAVSRATFYRLLKRGIGGLATVLNRPRD